MNDQRELTEQEKVRILLLAKEKNNQWSIIGPMMNRNPETIRKFYYNYQKSNQLSPKRGRPPTITDEVKNDVVQSMRQNPTQTLTAKKNFFKQF